MTIQEKHVSTRLVAVSHQWITHTLGGIYVCTLLTVITYVVKFITYLERHAIAGVEVIVGIICSFLDADASVHNMEYTGCQQTKWGFVTKVETPRAPTKFDSWESPRRQLSAWLVAPDRRRTASLQGRPKFSSRGLQSAVSAKMET